MDLTATAKAQKAGAPGEVRHDASFLDDAAKIVGSLSFQGILRIEGEVHGSIQGGDTLVIGPQAFVFGDIQAVAVTILGKVVGNVSGRFVEFSGSGSVRGDIRTKTLVIGEGGFFDGRSSGA